jgi:thiol-disulfide isomerase/thioredoxin
MRYLKLFGWLVLLVFALSACTAATPTTAPENEEPSPVPEPTEEMEEAEDMELPDEDPPLGAESQFSTDFSLHSVPYSEIISGGPGKDGIPAIDEPTYVGVDEADAWIGEQETVVMVHIGEEARAYPVQILMWHEIVNDTLGDTPVAVTYCTLCNTAIAYERTFDGQVLDFGTTGRLRFSNLIMYDRQTETWWQQATGEAIVGQYTGAQLTFVPANLVSWSDFRDSYPEATVLSRETGYSREYGLNPYSQYDDESDTPFLYRGPSTPDVLPQLARVLGVELNGEAVAYPYELLEQERVVNDTVGGVDVVVFWTPGTASALDSSDVARGRDVGSAVVFSRELDGETLAFAFDGDAFVDEATGTSWDVMGQALDGSRSGDRLTPVVSVNHFWFSWAAFQPETRVYGVESSGEDGGGDVSALVADIDISVYQGADALGGDRVLLSEVLAQGRPVVLNLWAGLCPTCRAEMPHLQAIHERYSDRVQVVAVDIGSFIGLGTEADGRALLEELGITFPAGGTSDAAIIQQYQVLGTPSTYFMLPSGEIIDQWTGIQTEAQLSDRVEALIAAAGDL